MTKATELREMSDDQLTHELRETQQELFRLRFQASTERLDAPSSLARLRRKVARVKTLQREREIAAAEESRVESPESRVESRIARILSNHNPQPSTLNPQPSTLNPQPSTLNPQP